MLFCMITGGSALGALYLGKKLIFLKQPAQLGVVLASSSTQLIKYFPEVVVEEVETTWHLIKDEEYWIDAFDKAGNLTNKYFANYRGNASSVSASILRNLESVLSN